MESLRKKRKVCIVSLNRSEYSRIRSVMKALLAREDLETVVAVLHSKYANNSILLENDGIPVHHRVHLSIDERSPYKTSTAVGEAAMKFAEVFNDIKPDILVILGDRYEALGVVVAAVYMNIFIVHIQGGEVTGTLDEHTRHALTKLSHLHFPATKFSAERLIKMGEPAEMVIPAGCPGTDMVLAAPKMSFEELRYEIYKLTKRRDVLERLEPGFFLVLQFPVATEVHEAEHQIDTTIAALERFNRPKLILTPTPDAGGDIVERKLRAYAERDPRAVIVKHLPPELFVNAMRLSSVMIGNSSAGIRETGYFGTPTLNIGSRQEGRERSSNIMDVPHDTETIVEAIQKQVEHGPYPIEMIYGEGDTGTCIAEKVATIDFTKIQKRLTY